MLKVALLLPSYAILCASWRADKSMLTHSRFEPKNTQVAMHKKQNFIELVADPAHDCYYSVDCNMVIAYIKGDIPGWRDYVDHMNKKGKRFFLTRGIYDDVVTNGKLTELPPSFHLFDDEGGYERAKRALPTLLEAFSIHPDAQCAKKFANDLEWLLQSGFSISGCPDIPELDILSGKAMAITANAKLVRRFLYNHAKRVTFERVVNDCALEHLADIRTVDTLHGTYVDRSAF